MAAYRIVGPRRLQGEVRVSGAKNAALPILAATILASGEVTIERVPHVRDVDTMGQLLERLGMRVRRDESGVVHAATIDDRPVTAEYDLVRRMRASFCVLGPLLARRGRGVAALPGGCRIGERPVDVHLRGLAALGADIRIERGNVVAKARRLRGARVSLLGPRGPTVTGAANVMCAAVLARGTTVLEDAPREPEVVDLGRFLNGLGARVEGLGTSTIVVEGVDELGCGRHEVIGDRIEAATWAAGVAVCGGRVRIAGVVPKFLESVTETLAAAGARIENDSDGVTVEMDARPRPIQVATRPYPGVPTDVQAMLTTLAAVANGESVVRDTVFPQRLGHVAELRRLGATLNVDGDALTIHGVERLTGAQVVASDLRAGAALSIAGVAADGETVVREIEHVERGYERFVDKLRGLGADMERVDDEHACGPQVGEE